MQAIFNEIMKSACQESLMDDYQVAKNAPVWESSVVLETADIARLCKKIALLPINYKTILFCYYCFGFSSKDTAECFGLNNVTGQLRYVQNMLAFFMGIKDARIDDASYREATQMALDEYAAFEDVLPLATPQYSARFRRRLRSIKAAQRWTDYAILAARRVAVLLLVCSIGFSSVLVANADVREQFFTWLVETFPQFSVFIAQSPESSAITMEDFKRVEVQYVPDGFVLEERTSLTTRVVYLYSNGQGEQIDITLSKPTREYLNTEDVVMQQIEFKSSIAYYWVKNQTSYIVWQQEGISCSIIANCSLEEAFKIADNIKS